MTVACEQGVVVHPCPHRDPAGAEALAAGLGAALAQPRGDGRLSLSPASLVHLRGGRLVLPSPNGATIAHALASTGATVVAGCLRNASAVARAAGAHLAADPLNHVVLVPAGERWPDGTLRPCLEDLLGAGAIASALRNDPSTESHADETAAALRDDLSTEARAAARLWRATPDPTATVRDSTSGRELTTAGWPDDVTIAVDVDATDTVARLVDDGAGPAFTAA